MSLSIRLGVVGLGRAAAQMLPSLTAHPEISIVACADPNPGARARFIAEFSGAAFATSKELCSRGEIDAAYVATPHQCHHDDVLTLCSYRKHALVEKPMALSVEDCRAMTDAARQAGVVLVVGHTHGFDPHVTLMRSLIESGEFGALRMITNFAYTNFLYRPRRPEELDTAQGGGIVYNQVPHQIEVARALARNPIRSVRAVAGRWDPSRPTEGALAALLEFEDGVAASLVYSGYDHFDSDEFHFWIGEMGEEKKPEHGRARRALRGVTDEVALREASGYAGRGARPSSERRHHPHFGVLIASCEGADLRPSADGVLIYEEKGVREISIPDARAYPNKDATVDEFANAILRGVAPLHDGAWGTSTMAAVAGLVESARERREIVLPSEVTADKS
jgi:phthalate 4,5-cis-dihydrodiol dehydrogenase